MPNRISVTGHTDTTPYAGLSGLTNWDLSAQRANAARRAMEESGLPTERISRVVGLASSVLFDREHPRSAVNRRISIVVLTQQAEQDANKTDLPATQRAAADSAVISDGASAGSPTPDTAPVDSAPVQSASASS